MYQACPGGAAMGYLELHWSEPRPAPAAAGPADTAVARQCPEAGARRHTAGKACQLNPAADPRDTSVPRPGSNGFERVFLSPCLGFLVCDLGKLRCARQGGGVTLARHTAFPCCFSEATASRFPKLRKSLQESRHCQVCAPG